jgi:hypothetical protein
LTPLDGEGGTRAARKLVFVSHEPTFGFELKFSFEGGAVRCRCRILGAVTGRFKITQENWTGDLARKGVLRINLDAAGPLLEFAFKAPEGP